MRLYLVYGVNQAEAEVRRREIPPPPAGVEPMWTGLSQLLVGKMMAHNAAITVTLDGKKLAGPDCRLTIFFSANDRTLVEDIRRQLPGPLADLLLAEVERQQTARETAS